MRLNERVLNAVDGVILRNKEGQEIYVIAKRRNGWILEATPTFRPRLSKKEVIKLLQNNRCEECQIKEDGPFTVLECIAGEKRS